MSKKKCNDGRKNNQPPKDHQFPPGQSGNPAGRPRKRKSTLVDDVKDVFGKERNITIDGETEPTTIRKLILEQIGRGAAQGDPKMIKLALPFLKIMDDAPELEILPEDKKIIDDFMKQFSDEGGPKDENED